MSVTAQEFPFRPWVRRAGLSIVLVAAAATLTITSDRSTLGRGAVGRTRARTWASDRRRPNRPFCGSWTTSTSASRSSTPSWSSAASVASSIVRPVVTTHSTAIYFLFFFLRERGCGLAPGDDPANAADRFEEALSSDLNRWPFQRARLQLAYGQWLRHQRRVAESRGVLREARNTFDALGCAPWGEQARRELRASGERSRRRVPEARDQLTAQELQIAQLAAGGLSNREIGGQLFLSHRTVSTHLYRAFPKLGITSRAELAAALAPAD